MLRTAFHSALDDTRRLTLEMAQLTLATLQHARGALERADSPEGAQAMVSDDAATDYQSRIEAACTEMLWKQQPIATEFRQVAAMLEVSADLQRAAHNASAIAKRVVRITNPAVLDDLGDVRALAVLAERMMKAVVDALEKNDADVVRDIAECDAEVERLYTQGIKALQEHMQAHPENVLDGTQLLFALASLRRACKRTRSVAGHVSDLVISGKT